MQKIVDPPDCTCSDEQLWQTTLEQLQLQMAQTTFDSWLKQTWLAGRDNGTFVIGTNSPFAKDWLENKLAPTIIRTLTGIVGQPVQVQFVLEAGKPDELPEPLSEIEPDETENGRPVLSPDDGHLWPAILSRLQTDLNEGIFEAWFVDTYVVSHTADRLVISTRKQTFAREWQVWMQDHGQDYISRVATELLGQPLQIDFVAKNNQDQSKADEKQTTTETCPFVPHIKTIGRKTGYVPLPRYYLKFWSEYLTRRWKTAGLRAFLLHQNLVALDTRKVTDPSFTNWSPIIEMTYEELGELISVDYTVITGRKGHCRQYEEARKLGQSRGLNCCGRHQAAGCRIEESRTGQLHCYYWRPGVLEVLDTEKLTAVDSCGKNRYHQIRLQVWHSLPFLTPFQASYLPTPRQEKHLAWLVNNAPKFDLDIEEWSNTPLSVETFIERAPDYDHGRFFYGSHQPNPYKFT